jgi:predicted transcriptional regulator
MAISLTDVKRKTKTVSAKPASPDVHREKRETLKPWHDATLTESNAKKADSPADALTVENGSKTVADGESAPSETGSKPVAKQPGKPVAKQEQIGSKRVAETADAKPVAAKPVAQPVAERVANPKQTGSKLVAVEGVAGLVGHEATLVSYVFEKCRQAGSLCTEELTKEVLTQVLETTAGTVKSVILRLERKGILIRAERKAGRGGWLRFSLSKDTFQLLTISQNGSKTVAKGQQSGSKPVAQPVAQPVAEASSSSGSDLDLKTTKTSERDEALPEDWRLVDVTPLGAIGFTQTHVRQLHRAGLLTAEELQDSIHAFAFDLEVNGKAKKLTGPPLNFFMGCLRKGPYAPPENFEPPEIRQRRLYLEAKEKAAKARRELEEKIEALEFEEWLGKLSLDERTRLVPTTEFAKIGSTAHTVELRRHFREQVWSEKRKSL